MEQLGRSLRAALKTRIEDLAWMSPETRAKALEKWAGFGSKIGYPDKWRDCSGLRTSRDSYLGNVLAAREFNSKWYLSMIGKPMDSSLWLMTLQTGNASYWPNQHEIVRSEGPRVGKEGVHTSKSW